ncbi:MULTISPECIES: hypothetical protein [unclassified Streptomyces]|uniref:hypothetical protein n=1 Tax=unclassified Streptomyces TaxID=2593676 RepID=UPI002E280A0B|nr:hypothetical protein [Streptomyces sp. NBC_00334]
MEPTLLQAALLIRVVGADSRNTLWRRLRHLVLRPAARETAREELAAFEASPTDPELAHALIKALVRRSLQDEEFRLDLDKWSDEAEDRSGGPSNGTNMISGGTYHGSVIQGGHISGVNIFNVPPGARSEDEGQ